MPRATPGAPARTSCQAPPATPLLCLRTPTNNNSMRPKPGRHECGAQCAEELRGKATMGGCATSSNCTVPQARSPHRRPACGWRNMWWDRNKRSVACGGACGPAMAHPSILSRPKCEHTRRFPFVERGAIRRSGCPTPRLAHPITGQLAGTLQAAEVRTQPRGTPLLFRRLTTPRPEGSARRERLVAPEPRAFYTAAPSSLRRGCASAACNAQDRWPLRRLPAGR